MLCAKRKVVKVLKRVSTTPGVPGSVVCFESPILRGPWGILTAETGEKLGILLSIDV